MVNFIASCERTRYGTNSAWKRPHDSGSASSNTTESRELEGTVPTSRHQPQNRGEMATATGTADAAMGPKEARSTVLTSEQGAMIVAFRKLTWLALDDCLYALQPSTPCLTRSSLHRCLQRHGTPGWPIRRQESHRKSSSSPIRLATSISISRKCKPSRDGYTCLLPSTVPPSSPMPNCMIRRRAWPHATF